MDEKKLLKKCKIIFIGSPHKLYKKLKFSKKHKVIDCWGFLKGKNAKKILITGVSGFIGQNFLEYIKKNILKYMQFIIQPNHIKNLKVYSI